MTDDEAEDIKHKAERSAWVLLESSKIRALLAEREELKSYKFMVAQVHRVCDEAGVPKPPENEPGVPWRVLRLLAEREAAGKVRERLHRASLIFDAGVTELPSGAHVIYLDDVLAIRATLKGTP